MMPNKTFRKHIVAIALAFPLGSMALGAHADYPERPIQLIVPWAAGGGSDAIARTIAIALEQELGQPINVVNRAGGGSVVGHTVLANAKPDGYTIGMMTGEVNMMHWQGLTKLTYKDYTPIAQINYDYAGVQVSADSPYKNVGELIEAIRSKPAGTLKASGVGQGGIWHVAFGGLLVGPGARSQGGALDPERRGRPGHDRPGGRRHRHCPHFGARSPFHDRRRTSQIAGPHGARTQSRLRRRADAQGRNRLQLHAG